MPESETPRTRTLPALLGAFVLLFSTVAKSAAQFTTEEVNSDTDTGLFSAIAVESDDTVNIVYGHATADRVMISTYSDSWGYSEAETINNSYTAIAIGPDGNKHLAYYLDGAMDLRYATGLGSSWTITTVDSGGNVGANPSIAVDAWGHPHIAYQDFTNKGLKYARWTGSAWDISTVDTLPGSPEPSLALDAMGRPHIAYNESSGYSLRYASWTGTGWSISTIDTPAALRDVDLVLDGNGYAHIAYYHASGELDLIYVNWTGTSWSTSTVASADDVGRDCSIALDGDGAAHISYFDYTNSEVLYAYQDGGWNFDTIDSADDHYTGLTIDGEGTSHVSYMTSGGGLSHAYDDTTGFEAAMAGGNGRGRSQAPTDFAANTVYETSITWNWSDNATNELGYRIYGGTSPTGQFSLIVGSGTLGVDADTYTETGLTAGTTYYRYVVAVNAGGFVPSAGASAITGEVPPPSVAADEQARGLDRAADGSLYAVGWASMTSSYWDIWIGKYDSDALLVSSRVLNGSGNLIDEALEVAVGASGDIYAVGYTSLVDLGQQIWLGRFDSSLAVISSQTFNIGSGHSWNKGTGIVAAPNGDLYVTGHYKNGGANGTIWLARYNSALVLQSSASFNNGYDLNFTHGIALDADGDVFVAGQVPPAPATSNNIWVGKFDSNLVFITSTTRAGPGGGSDVAQAVAVDGNGAVYVGGGINLSGGDMDIWLAKYDNDLAYQNEITIEGSANNLDSVMDIAIGNNNNVVASGILTPTGNGADVWHAEYDGDLSLVSSMTYNHSGSSDDGGYALALATAANSSFVAGHVTNSDKDIYVAKLGISAASPLPPTAPGTFSGNFAAPGGAVYDLGATESANRVIVDTISVGGPFVYITGHASRAATGLDAFVVKYDYTGAMVASASFVGAQHEHGRALAHDASGNIYVAGHTDNTQASDVLVLKFDSNLTFVASATWAHSFGNSDQGQAIAVHPNGDIYVAGNASDGQPKPDSMLIRYTSNLVMVSSAVWGDPSGQIDQVWNIAVDGNGDIITIGDSKPGGSTQLHVLKFDAALTYISSASFGDGNIQYGYGVVTDDSNNIYVTGTNGPTYEILNIKYDSSLAFVSSAALNGPAVDTGLDIVRDGSGDLIVGGYFTNGSDTDIIAIKYDTDWVLLSSVVYAGAGGVNDWGYGVAVDSAGLIYVTGNTVNTDQDVVTLRFALPGSVGGPQTRIWDGGGADNLASNPLNWSGNTAPVDGDSILFNATSVTPSSWDITGIALNDVTMAGDYDTGTLHLATHMVVNGDFTRSTGGVIMQTGADLRVRGDFSWGVGGSVFTNDSLIILDGSERQELSSGNSWLANLHIESSSEVVMTSKMYMLGEPALTHSSGDLRAGGFDHQFNGGWARTGGVFLAESSTITFGPQLDISSVSITGGSGAFNHVQLKSLSAVGASTLAVVSPLDIDGNFSLVNIHFVPGPYTHTLGGDWNMTGGSFGPATGTIRFDGSSTTISAVMPIVFNELELAGTYAAFNSSFSASTFTADTSGAALYFTADATYTFGTLAIGSPGLASRMSLRSSSDGTPWHLVVTGTAAVSRADVMDSDASGGILISAHDGDNLDAGANFNWSFQFTAPELSAPSFALTTPETGAVINHLGMIAGTAADASGVASASFAIQKDAGNYYDGTDFVSVTPVWLPADLITIDGSTLAYQAVYVTSSVVYTDGSSYSVDMTAADIYGSSAASAGLATITIDKTAPTAASFRVLTATGAEHPEGGMVDLLAGVTAQINIQDALAGLSQSTQAALGFGVSYSTTAGGSWSDGAWSVSTPSPGAFAFAEYQGKLYAAAYGGTFDVIAYDGIEWSGSATFTGQVYALAAHDGKLYAGTYVSAGTGAVYEFDGGSWSLSAEFPGETTVASLASYNGMLYAGTRQGAKIFAFDGSTWTLSADIAGNSGVISMAEYRGRLYAGTDAGGQVYVFDASTWSLSVDFAATGVYVRDLVVYDGKLYAGTSHVSGQASFGKVFAFDGAGWSELFDVSSVGETVVQDLAVYRGRLYAATSVLGSPDPDQGKVLVYDGAQWHESGGFPDDDVMNALGVYEGRLFAGSANTGAQIHVLDPPSVTLSGAEGSTSLETLSAYGLNLAESTNTETCGGSYPCGATNQVVFTYSDRAGNVKRAGPYAIAASANPPNLRVWDGGGADDLASNPQNWTLDTLPVSGDSVLFNATSLDNDCTWDLTGVTLNDFTLAADFQHATRVTLSTDLVVAGDLVVSEGQFLENRQKMIIGGDWTMNGGGVMVSAHIILNGSSPQTINGPYSFSGSTITIQSTSEVVMNTRMYIDDGWFELKSGTFSAGSFDHWFGGHWTQTGGYFNAQDSTLTVINTEAEYPQTFTTLPGSPFNNFVINTTTDVTVLSALDINGNFIIRNDPTWSTGTFHAGDFTHTVAGHFLHSAGYFDPGAGTIKFDGAENSSVTVRSDFAFHGLEVAKSVGTKHLYALSDIVANGTMSVTAGSWWPMAHTHRFRGNIDSPLGRMLSGTGTTYLDGSSPQTMTGSSDNFWDLVIANAAGVTMPGSAYGLNIQGDLTIMPGASFDATDDYFWVQGDVIASGTFTGGGASILTLNGSAHQRVYGNGNSVGGIAVTNISSVTFVSSFTATSLAANASGGTLFFNAGSTFTVADFRPGNAGTAERLRLRSTADGSPWHLVVTSTAAPVRVDARDSDAAGGDTVLANDKDNLDSGNNVNWIFVFPQMPDPPTATVHGASSITWNWSAAPGASTYRVYPASETSTLLYETSVLSYAATGLGANERHRIGLAAAQGTINTALAYSATVHTLARPPTATTMNAVYQTSASFSWGLNGNSAFTAAEVQRSTDAAGYSAIGIMPVTSITAYHLIGCTTYYFRVRNVNGDGLTTSFDSTISTYTGAPTPAPPGELNARSLAGSKILLNWVRSPFAGVTAYRIYYGSGAASADVYAATPVEVSSAATSYTTPALGSGDTYAFGLRAVHACGIEEQNTRVRAFATALASLDGVRAAIKVPHSGKTIGGNRVTIVAELELGDPGQTQKVTFQYKASSDTTGWADIPAVNTGGRHPNPDLTAPYFIHWDVDAPLDETDYDLRVVAWDIFGASDTSPGAITITIDRADPDIAETKLVAGANTGKVEKKQKIHQELTSTVQSSAEDTSQATEVVIPPNAINASTVTVTVINNPATAPPAPSEVTATTIISEVSLSNDQHQLSGGNVAAVTLHYPDDDNNGIIDGTAISAASLQLYSATCSTCSWSKDFASTVNTASKTITGYTPHFSFFAAFVPAAAPAHADLSAVRVYPNPYKPNNGNNDDGIPFAAGNAASGIIFDQLPADAGIKIYTVTGRRVAELNSAAAGTIQWDARNDAGRDVASGLYIAVITGTGQVSVVRKLLLVR